jgi:Mrp family chromosome partitioning ATPase
VERNAELNGNYAEGLIPKSELTEIDVPTSRLPVIPALAPETQKRDSNKDILKATEAAKIAEDAIYSKTSKSEKPAKTSKPAKAAKPAKNANAQVEKKLPGADVSEWLREQCRQFCLAVFYRDQEPAQSLGFTSAVGGEGKTFLSMLTAGYLADDTDQPVTLVECNWERPSVHQQYSIPSTPGLAEWLRGECRAEEIRHVVKPNLTVIPAGNGKRDAVKLVHQFQRRGLLEIQAEKDELLIVDLPAITSSGYGLLAAKLVDSLVVVVRAGTTPEALVAETCNQLESLPVHGILLNQMESNIPLWIRKLI